MNIAINYNTYEEYTYYLCQLYNYQSKYKKTNLCIQMFSTTGDLIYDIECHKHFDIIVISATNTESSINACIKIKALAKSSLFIMVSEDTLLAPKAVEIGAYRYVVRKNKTYFLKALHKAYLEVIKNQSNFYVIASKHKWIKILSADIVYCYKSGKMSIIVTETEEFRERIPLYQLLDKLNKISKDFIAIERGFIISTSKLRRISEGHAYLEGDVTLPIGITYISDIKKRFHKLNTTKTIPEMTNLECMQKIILT
jgi:hypothetical protein